STNECPTTLKFQQINCLGVFNFIASTSVSLVSIVSLYSTSFTRLLVTSFDYISFCSSALFQQMNASDRYPGEILRCPPDLKVGRWEALSIVPSMNLSLPTPFAAIHPQTMTDPPPCFTVQLTFCGNNSAFGFRQTFVRPSPPKTINLHSSVNITLSQNVGDLLSLLSLMTVFRIGLEISLPLPISFH
ncbi:hypothetical protein FF38_02238, partial [Lucilia cuprina]